MLGTNAAKDFITAGGTPSGILIVMFLCTKNLNTSVTKIATINDTNKPCAPVQAKFKPPSFGVVGVRITKAPNEIIPD